MFTVVIVAIAMQSVQGIGSIQTLKEQLESRGSLSVSGPAEVLEAYVYVPLSAEREDVQEILPQLLSAKIDDSSNRIKIVRTAELRRVTDRESEYNQLLAVTAMLTDLKHALPLDISPILRAEVSLRSIQNYLHDYRTGVIAERAIANRGSYRHEITMPLDLLASELLLSLGAKSLLEFSVGERVVFSTRPTTLQRPFPKSTQSAIASFLVTEGQLLNVDIPFEDSNAHVVSYLTEYLDNLAADPSTKTIVMHLWRGGPRFFHANVAAYSESGALRAIAPVLLDGRDLYLNNWSKTAPAWLDEIDPVAVTQATTNWAEILTSLATKVNLSESELLQTLKDEEPLSAVFTACMDAVSRTTGKQVWAWLPDSALDGAVNYIQNGKCDVAGFLRWQISTGRMSIRETDGRIIVRPSDPNSAYSFALPRRALKELAADCSTEEGLSLMAYVEFLGKDRGRYFSTLGRRVSDSVKALDKTIGFDGFQIRPALVSLLNDDGFLESVLNRGPYEKGLAQLPPVRRILVQYWIASHPKLGEPTAHTPVADIWLNATFSSAEVSQAIQTLTCRRTFEDVLFVEPFLMEGDYGEYKVPPLSARALGFNLGNLIYEGMILHESVGSITVRIGSRPVVEIALEIGPNVIVKSVIPEKLPQPGRLTKLADLKGESHRQLFKEIDAWVETMRKDRLAR